MIPNYSFLFAVVNCFIFTSLYSQSSIVGPGSSYSDIFPSSTPVTYDVPGGGLVSVTLSNGSISASQGLWNLTAQGGANATILLSLTESAAQTTLTGSLLTFGISNDNNSLLGILGGGHLHPLCVAGGCLFRHPWKRPQLYSQHPLQREL